MKKKALLFLAAGLLTLSTAMNVYAAEWKLNETGWWYQHDDGSWPAAQWEWIDGKCYYFDQNGYCLLNTVTPDGYTVDASGAWTVDGVVQIQDVPAQTQTITSGIVSVGEIDVLIPAGYTGTYSDGGFTLSTADSASAISVLSEPFDEEQSSAVLAAGADSHWFLDLAIAAGVGSPSSISNKDFRSGTWRYYYYGNDTVIGSVVPVNVYARFYGSSNVDLQMVVHANEAGANGINGDEFMNHYIY